MPNRFFNDDLDTSGWDLNQERAFWEKMLNQRINFFLIFFVAVILGVAISNTKELALFILSVGAVILWILAVLIINTTRKINLAVKELNKSGYHPTGVVDKRAKGRTVRLVVGFGLPVFCASIITLIFLAGLSGLYTFNLPSKDQVVQSVQTTIEKGKESIVEKKNVIKDNINHFENVDSVIKKSKSVRISVPIDTFKSTTTSSPQVVQAHAQPARINPNFKNIDRVIKGSEVYSNESSGKPATKQAKIPQVQQSNPAYQKNIQVVVDSSNKPTLKKNKIVVEPKKEKEVKAQQPDPHFQSIENVIKEAEKKP